MDLNSKRGLMVSSKWGQAIVIVFLFGFFVLGLLAYRTYTSEPPIPAKVVDPAGQVLFTRADIIHGQETFLRNGLMEYGSIFGHGAYLGPDFTADYLHRAAVVVLDQYGGAASDQARAETITDFKTNRYDATTGTLEDTAAQAVAFKELQALWTAPQGHHGSPADLRSDGFFQLVGVDVSRFATRTRILLHQQLAVRSARGKPPHCRCDCLERAFVDRAAGGHWAAARGFRAMEFSGLARARASDRVVPPSGFDQPDARAARHGVLLPGHGGALPSAGAAGRRVATLPRGHLELLRPRPRSHPSLQHRADVARSACDLLGCNLLSCGGHFSCAHDHAARAQGAAMARVRPARRARHRGVWKLDRRIRGRGRMDSSPLDVVWGPRF
jgi:Nitric oxide reductase subunit B, cytochrome c-like domain